MAITLPDARALSDDILEALRLRALRGCERGFTEAEIADLLGVSRETVSRWWTAYAAGGVDHLPGDRTGRPQGSGRSLSDDQGRHLQRLIDEHAPEELGIAAPLWNRRAVRELIHREYGLWLPVRTVGEYLKRWGYTAKRPRRHARKQDPDEVEEWLEETYPALEARAQREGAEVQWCDETGVAADAFPGRGYARVGEPAAIEMPDPHLRVSVISSITNAGDVRFRTYTESLTSALFLTFLKRLVREAPCKVFLIVDRHPAHDSVAVETWLEEHRDQLELFYLPRRAPERNPDEYLNNDLKANAKAGGLPNNKAELRAQLEAFLHKLEQIPEHVMSYFLNPWVEYAAGEL